MTPFMIQVEKKVAQCGNHLCVGIDPHRSLWNSNIEPDVEEFLINFSRTLINESIGRVAAVKFQSAFFESFGEKGWRALKSSIQFAKQHGILTILDAKRGDISSTMSAYAEAAFVDIDADALTVTAYMGSDCLNPLNSYLSAGKGIYIVWLTSNPSGKELQQLVLQDGSPVFLNCLENWSNWGQSNSLQDSMGYVIGATVADEIDSSFINRVSDLCGGKALVPGFGKQGGQMSANLRQVLSSRKHLIPVSRGLYGTAYENGIQNWDSFQKEVRQQVENYADLFSKK